MKHEKLFISLALAFFLSFTIVHGVSAANVALVVKNINNLDSNHEKPVLNLLNQTGHNITLVDKTVNVDYKNFDLIVIAGRPASGAGEPLDSFVAGIPVNDVPTIAIDQTYPVAWGWTKPIGLGLLSSSQVQHVIVQKNHPIATGFNSGDKIFVHIIFGTQLVDMFRWQNNFTTVASADYNNDLGVINFAGPRTPLLNGKSISDNSAVVFFGIVYPVFWTDDAKQLFINSVNWLTNDSDGDGIKNYMDNCATIPNSDQSDIDNDQIGDACDTVDNRADLIIEEISFPRQRDQCELIPVTVTIKNIGNYPATRYTIDMSVDGSGLTLVSNTVLNKNQEASFRMILDSDATCGNPQKLVTVNVRDVLPAETDTSNNVRTEILTFSSVKMDVDNDRTREMAKDFNNNATDGYEEYFDQNSNSNATAIDGDNDLATDYLIDIGINGIFEKYWDPDEGILTNLQYNGTLILIDVNNDNRTDSVYNTTDGTIQYLDKDPPVISQIQVSPTFGSNTWVFFNISANVTDEWSGIQPYSCKYTLDGINWQSALYSGGKCFKNNLSASLGTNLTINFQVRDHSGNLGNGMAITRTVVIRPLNVEVNTDKTTYSPNSTVFVTGKVTYADNNQKVPATISYSLLGTGITGILSTNGQGLYSFSFNYPNSLSSYTLKVDATAPFSFGTSSKDLNVPPPSTSPPTTSSSGGGGSAIELKILGVESPKTLEVFSGDQIKFEAIVRNKGNVPLYGVNLLVESDIYTDKGITSVDILPSQSKTFVIAFNTSKGMSGEHQLKLTARNPDTSATSTTTVVIKILIPVIQLTNISLPDFVVGEKSVLNVTLTNSGNKTAEDVAVSLDAPEGWEIGLDSQNVDINIAENVTVSFDVTPKETSGDLVLSTNYNANGQNIFFQNTTSVSAKRKEFGISEITGLVAATVTTPLFYLPASIFFGIVLYKFFIAKKIGAFIQHQQRPAPRPKYIPNYDVWEEVYRRKLSRV